MQKIITKATQGDILNESDIYEVLSAITDKAILPEEAAEFLLALSKRGETAEEIASFAKFMKEKAKKPLINKRGLIDVCGTGGDCLGTFNISTAVSFVIAGAGAKVVKHGNHSVSSKSGSADVLEALGINIKTPNEKLQKVLDEAGMVFLYAPDYHQSTAQIKEIRKSIGLPTIFNLLGPLTNPANLDYQVIGVYDKEKCRMIAETLLNLGVKEAMIVHGNGGMDELTTTGLNTIFQLKNGEIEEKALSAEQLGLKRATQGELLGGDAKENAQIILSILQGKNGAKRDIVLLNAAAALIVCGIAEDFDEGIKKAAESIDSGKAMNVMEKLKNVSR